MAGQTAPWRIGVDVGGTFTDLVLIDQAGAVNVTKVPSTPEDPSRGVINAVDRAALELGLPTAELLDRCSLFTARPWPPTPCWRAKGQRSGW